MLVRINIGMRAGQVMDVDRIAGLAMLADGRASKPEDPAPAKKSSAAIPAASPSAAMKTPEASSATSGDEGQHKNRFAEGGIIDKPVLAIVGEESGTHCSPVSTAQPKNGKKQPRAESRKSRA